MGTNSKLSEFNCAIGLSSIDKVTDTLTSRRKIDNEYRSLLTNVTFQRLDQGANRAYTPILIENEDLLIRVINKLCDIMVYPRRYFYPVLSDFVKSYDDGKVDVATDISRRILCLPNYKGLSLEDVSKISEMINVETN